MWGKRESLTANDNDFAPLPLEGADERSEAGLASPNVGVPFHAANLRPFGAPPSKGRREKKGRICAANESTRAPLTRFPSPCGEWIVSHVWHEILRLSPHLFWLGLFTHRAFSSAQDDDTRGRKGSHLGDTLHVLELAVLYYDTSSPLEKGRAKGAGWIHAAV